MLAGFLVGQASGSGESAWYQSLAKPAFQPPDWAFPVVWSLLYFAMGFAAWLVWRDGGFAEARGALILFFLQLAFNLIWSPVFFGAQQILGGLVVILIVLILVALTMAAFWRVNRWAGLLFVPYLAWVGYATALNFAIWRLN